MKGLWHLVLAGRQAYANWRSQRCLMLTEAWRLTALDAQKRMQR